MRHAGWKTVVVALVCPTPGGADYEAGQRTLVGVFG